MNRNPSGLLFSLCIDGFVKYKTAEGLSQRTVDSYEWVLRKWMEKIDDQPIVKITSADVLNYMTYLRTEYIPHTSAKPNPSHDIPTRKLSQKHCETTGSLSKLFSVGRSMKPRSCSCWILFCAHPSCAV